MGFLLGALYLLFTTAGVVLMKLGGDSIKIAFGAEFSFKIGLLTTIGFIAYLVSFILWQKLLVSYNISFIVPLLTGLAQILACVAAFIFFKEPFSVSMIVGIAMIITGITLLSIKG